MTLNVPVSAALAETVSRQQSFGPRYCQRQQESRRDLLRVIQSPGPQSHE